METLITRAEAKAQGLTHYFTGEPCKYGHVCKRYVSHYNCFECNLDSKEKMTAYCQSDKGKATRREYHLKHKFGITTEDYQAMLVTQDGVCKTCLQPDPTGRLLAVDHCHSTGKIRGLLCHNCNVSLGKINDSIPTLLRMLDYLRS